ncbi:MAG: phosphoribosylformylglycinamidine synthase subunit PurL [Candidatus Omnitrophica bacterium]|nr:phosphoribosylformylglycinamidine synthase subunit PurL [Candidatus Omnitrophota bacterium]
MFWKIEIREKEGIFDAVGEGIRKDILDLGIKKVKSVSFVQVYNIYGELNHNDIQKITDELLVDPIVQEAHIVSNKDSIRSAKNIHVIEVAYNPGVMDPVEDSVLKGISDLGIKGVSAVKTAKKYIIRGNLSAKEINLVQEKLLYNKLIQHIVTEDNKGSLPIGKIDYHFNLVTVDLLGASDRKLQQISKDGQLFLSLIEMRQIKKYFQSLGRNPTDCELETIAQTWSEHCAHKTFRGKIRYEEKLIGNKRVRRLKIDNLLKTTIMKVTQELNKPWCVSVFRDNAGVISFDEKNNICFKVETHNHPSALEPFGGANTGIGGVIRDPLGTGLGAKPIFNTDVFCFGPPDYSFSKLPPGTLHPKRIAKGVVAGVRDYGNKMGIPTVNGAVLFDEGFVCNPLVYCGTAGVLPRDKAFKKASKGELIVLVGGKTGRDGIHGATFSSGELTHESETISSGAVQIGNPIQEKKMVDAILQARDAGLYTCITDCGAGGLSSAVGEMAQALGCRVDLEKVPLKYSGLSYTEIWISESQERMVLSVPKENWLRLEEIFKNENVEATVIGEFTNTKRLQLYYQGNLVCDLDMTFLHEGLPKPEKKARFIQPRFPEPKIPPKKDFTKILEKLLSDYSICSKEWVIRQYDHEVQGGSVLKPLVGVFNDGPSDAAIVRPFLDSEKAVIVSCGINFRYGLIDPYWMAASCIDEALRQIIAVGGSLDQVALLDNFCWGNPDKPDRLGTLVRAALGCYDTAKGFGTPFISGKDSLNNEYSTKGVSKPIPGTLLISAIAVMDDIKHAISMYTKNVDDLIYIVGNTYEELAGSYYYKLLGAVGNSVPRVRVESAKKTFVALSKAVRAGLISAMHDCSEGGLAVACAEMAFAGNKGMTIFLKEVPFVSDGGNSINKKKKSLTKRISNDTILFSESNSRFIVEVPRRHKEAFERMLEGISFGCIGCVCQKKDFVVFGLDGKPCIRADIGLLRDAWKRPLAW